MKITNFFNFRNGKLINMKNDTSVLPKKSKQLLENKENEFVDSHGHLHSDET